MEVFDFMVYSLLIQMVFAIVFLFFIFYFYVQMYDHRKKWEQDNQKPM